MQRVLVESPFAAPTPEGISANIEYLKAAMRECCLRGEAPFASHLLYTQFLDDTIPRERAIGIGAGLQWGLAANKTVVYVDRGISRGMQFGIDAAKLANRPIEYRHLGDITRVDLHTVRP